MCKNCSFVFLLFRFFFVLLQRIMTEGHGNVFAFVFENSDYQELND